MKTEVTRLQLPNWEKAQLAVEACIALQLPFVLKLLNYSSRSDTIYPRFELIVYKEDNDATKTA